MHTIDIQKVSIENSITPSKKHKDQKTLNNNTYQKHIILYKTVVYDIILLLNSKK